MGSFEPDEAVPLRGFVPDAKQPFFQPTTLEETASAAEARKGVFEAQAKPYAAFRERVGRQPIDPLTARLLPFPGLTRAIIAPESVPPAAKSQGLGYLLNPLPEIVTEPFHLGVEGVRKTLGPGAAKLIEDTMASLPALHGITRGVAPVRDIARSLRAPGLEFVPSKAEPIPRPKPKPVVERPFAAEPKFVEDLKAEVPKPQAPKLRELRPEEEVRPEIPEAPKPVAPEAPMPEPVKAVEPPAPEAPVAAETRNLRSPLEELKSLVNPETGGFTRGGDYIGEVLKVANKEELNAVLEWTKSNEATPYVARFGREYVENEIRRRAPPEQVPPEPEPPPKPEPPPEPEPPPKQAKQKPPPKGESSLDAEIKQVQAELEKVGKKDPVKAFELQGRLRILEGSKIVEHFRQKAAAEREAPPFKPTMVQRAPKEAKAELLTRLNDAYEKAPSVREVEGPTPKVTIQIPGDGTFTIPNTKESLEGTIKAAKGIAITPPLGDFKPRKVTVPKRTGEMSPELWVQSELPSHMLTNAKGELVKAVPAEIPGGEGIPFFVISDGEKFYVMEPRSGTTLTYKGASTVKGAIKTAADWIEEKKGWAEDFSLKDAVNEAVKGQRELRPEQINEKNLAAYEAQETKKMAERQAREAEWEKNRTDEVEPGPEEPEGGVRGFPIRAEPKDVPQSVTPLKRNFVPPQAKGEQPIVRRGDIIRDMQDAFQVPIRSGHANYVQMKAAGFFKVKEEVIRLQKANDMETTAHEIGHFISKKFLGRKAVRLPGRGELLEMGRDLYGTRQPNGGYAEEGLAEFVRFYVTDPQRAKAKAPVFSAWFEGNMDLADVRDTLLTARSNWQKYQEQPAVARILSQVSINEREPIQPTLAGLYKQGLDDLHYIKIIEERMNQGKPPLNASDSPYTLARLFRGWVGRAEEFLGISGGKPFDAATFRPAEGVRALNEILAPFEKAGQLDDLRAYLTALSAKDRMKRGHETGFARADIEETLRIYGAQETFVKADAEVQAYQNALLDYAQKKGFLSAEQVEAMQEAHPHHVAFHRLIEGMRGQSGVAGTQKFADVGLPPTFKRAKGSAKEIVDPLESLVKDTYAIISAADRNEIGQSLVRLANSAQGMGKYIERVPRDKIPVTIKDTELENVLKKYGRIKETVEFQKSKQEVSREIGAGGIAGEPTTKGQQLIENRVKEALTARGFSEGEAGLYIQRLKSAKTEAAVNSIIEKIVTEQTIKTVTQKLELDLPPEVLAGFRPDPKVPGMDNILSVRFNGKPILYQVHPQLYETLAGLDRNSTNILIKILSLPAKALRLGATTLSPEFAVRNPARDAFTAALYSQYGIINVPGGDLIRGLMHVVKGDELYHAWKAGGGEHSMLVSLDRKSLQKTLSDVLRSGEGGNVAKTIIRHPIESARMLSELGEEVTRIGEFAKAIRYEGGLTRENILRGAMASREVTLDFSRMGSAMKATGANQIIAFLNPNLQGMDKMARFAKEHPALFMTRGIATITAPSLLLYMANHDDPRYRDLPAWQRDLFWIIPTGTMSTAQWAKMTAEEKQRFNAQHTIWRIPKPFEPGLLFGTLPERALDWVYKNDPQAFNEFKKSFFRTLPNPIPTGPLPLIENFANYSMFRDRPIVPKGRENLQPSLQYSHYTTETAKRTGDLIGYSPAKIENLVQGWLGALGRLGLDALDTALPHPKSGQPSPEKTMADIPGVRAFVARFPGQPESVQKFYDNLDKARKFDASYRALLKEGKVQEAKRYREQHSEDIRNAMRLSSAAEVISLIRQRQTYVRESGLPADQKRKQIESLEFRIADIAKNTLRRAEAREQ